MVLITHLSRKSLQTCGTFVAPVYFLFAIFSLHFAHAVTVLRASVISSSAILYAPDAQGKLAPAQRAPQGSVLQVTEQVRSGWRQVVVRFSGQPPKWGWVPDRDLRVEGGAMVPPTATQNTTITPDPQANAAPRIRGFKNERVTLGVQGGALLGFGAATTVGPAGGLNLGVRLWGDLKNAFFAEADLLGTFRLLPTSTLGTVTTVEFQIPVQARLFLLWRNVMGSGFYMGPGLGSQIFVGQVINTDGTNTARLLVIRPLFSGGFKAGYSIRPTSVFSFGPEIQYNFTIGTPTYYLSEDYVVVPSFNQSLSLLAQVRFHF